MIYGVVEIDFLLIFYFIWFKSYIEPPKILIQVVHGCYKVLMRKNLMFTRKTLNPLKSWRSPFSGFCCFTNIIEPEGDFCLILLQTV